MTTYAGYDLLRIAPNLVTAWGSDVSRALDAMATDTGNVVTTTRADPPARTFTLAWGCATRADLVTLETFLAARQGQLVPCWIPTYQRDAEVDGIVPFFGWVVRTDRTEFEALVEGEPAWHYWHACSPGNVQFRCDYFDTVTDLLDGTQQWSTSPGAGPTQVGTLLNADTSSTYGTVFSRLRFCRMARDSYRVTYRGAASIVEAEFVELPGEVP